MTSVNEGVDYRKHRDYGINSDADRLAIGANLLSHLLDAEIKTINVLKKSEIVRQVEFACPVGNCSEVK